jgi:hypothetical protein
MIKNKRLKQGDKAIVVRNGVRQEATVVKYWFREQTHNVQVQFPNTTTICTFTNNKQLKNYFDLDLSLKINNNTLTKIC